MGANIEAQSQCGETATQIAANGGQEDIVRLLLEKGANFEAMGDHGTAICNVAGDGCLAIIRRLPDRYTAQQAVLS